MNWVSARRAIRDRIAELDVLQRELSERSGVSMATWSKLLNGPNEMFDKKTLRAAARSLGWSPDSIDRLLAGQDPIVETPDPSPPAAPLAMAASGSNVDMAALAAILGPLVEAVDRQTAALREQNQRIEQVLGRLDPEE
jgi:transcriptional regulator with XRE-family HTH domain